MLWDTFGYLGGGVASGCGCGTVHLSENTGRGLCKSKNCAKPIMGSLGEGSIRKEQAWENKEKEERYKGLPFNRLI